MSKSNFVLAAILVVVLGFLWVGGVGLTRKIAALEEKLAMAEKEAGLYDIQRISSLWINIGLQKTLAKADLKNPITVTVGSVGELTIEPLRDKEDFDGILIRFSQAFRHASVDPGAQREQKQLPAGHAFYYQKAGNAVLSMTR